MSGASPASFGASAEGGTAYRLLRRIVDIRPAEAQALLWAWLYIFCILCSYSVMRPIRDQAGIAGGVNNLQWLFTGTLVGMLALNLPFAWLVRTMPRSRFIPLTYRFFAANILLFALAQYAATGTAAVWVGRVFFIWTSVFNLFVVSVFWALLVDLFTADQGKRLFGMVAAGASVGAITGSALTASLAALVPPSLLLLVAAILLEVAVFCVRRLGRLSPALSRPQSTADAPDPATAEGELKERQAEQGAAATAMGGGVLSGIARALGQPYLLNVSIFMLLFSVTSTFLYFQQASIIGSSLTSRAAQTQFLATIDLVVNVLTLGVQLFLTGRIVRTLGVTATIALLPGFSIVGFAVLATFPALSSVVPFQVLRRAANFAITRPTREVLFTVLPREDRYKAKSFIDTVVYRLGDQVGAWSYAGLAGLGWTLHGIALVAIPVCVLWLGNAVWLGWRETRMAAEQAAATTRAAAPA
jgi:AAA family ATP:ADP antiporter